MPTTQARLFMRQQRYADGTFPAMNYLKKDLNRQGVPLTDMHVGYAVAKGTFYCAACEDQVVNPPSDFYQKAEFWRCKCGKINYVKA